MDALAAACEERRPLQLPAEEGRDARRLSPPARRCRSRARRPLSFRRSGLRGRSEKLSVGSAILREALLAATGWDEYIAGICFREVGDSGETVSLLVEGRTAGQPLSLADAEFLYARLAQDAAAPRRRSSCCATVSRAAARSTLRYFVKVITGNLRIGLQAKMVEEAVAAATGAPHEAVRLANNRLGRPQPRRCRRAARRTRPHRGPPVPPDGIHARQASRERGRPRGSRKLPGGRQVRRHSRAGPLRRGRGRDLQPRHGGRHPRRFPEICEACSQICRRARCSMARSWRGAMGGRCRSPCCSSASRASRCPAVIEEVPVVFMAYDILYRDGAMLIDLPVEERRAAARRGAVRSAGRILRRSADRRRVTRRISTATSKRHARGATRASCSNAAAACTNPAAAAAPGARSSGLTARSTSWSPPRSRATDAARPCSPITPSGALRRPVRQRRQGLLRAHRRRDPRTDAHLPLARRSSASAACCSSNPKWCSRSPSTACRRVPRHKSGYALRFPRILRWRRDKRPEEADNIDYGPSAL